jgi:SNF2 family DNA or RNA helicase
MKVSTAEPFKIVYSLFEHEYLGYLFESFAVQLDDKGRLTLKNQNISFKNASEFSLGIDDADFELIRLMDSIQQDAVHRKFSNKKSNPGDFFLKTFNKDKGDPLLQEAILSYIEGKKKEMLPLLKGKQVFEMGHDGEPTWRQIELTSEEASILFHVMRNEDNTHYFPTIKYKGEKIEFSGKNAILVCKQPAWLLVDSKLFSFRQDVEGAKLKPFLAKKYILIPKKLEDEYYRKFVSPLIAGFDVHAKGFEIRSEKAKPNAKLVFHEMAAKRTSMSLFTANGESDDQDIEEESSFLFSLYFEYGQYTFQADSLAPTFVQLEVKGDDYLFHKIYREQDWERSLLESLRDIGLELRHGKCLMPKAKGLQWMMQQRAVLEEQFGMQISQQSPDGKRYFMGASSISVEVRENNDWFDILAVVRFGPYEIPFLEIRKYIIRKKKEFTLPNGEIAIIPEEWFTQYAELFHFSEENDLGLTLKKHHLTLVKELQSGHLAKVSMDRKLEKLKDFEEIEDHVLPEKFIGELRPYQKAGYNWMMFLQEYHFGGCLADDMGLGKTVQTLAFLQKQKEGYPEGVTLLVMPTSLVYNWEVEAKRFTPGLRVLNYTGIGRAKEVSQFAQYDLIITSYGTVRIDLELLKQFHFHYVILDESQVIKNPDSIIARAVKELRSRFRLILTGTPIENSTLDLWSQMSFINPGLLGTQSFFRNEFLTPIEKKQDEEKTRKLYSIIKPFILRRQKNQVVKELPDKIESVQYVSMTSDQEHEYEQVKSNYRNLILDSIDEVGLPGSQMVLLQGLTKLRLIANHPKLSDEAYAGSSGKLEDALYMLESALSENHKILIFSQFVKHLAIYEKIFKQKELRYAYLDGSTRDRQKQVETFQQDEGIRLFLISLKAGGLGLNLTAADYVFLLDPWWNPAIENQAVDRAYRIGQQNNVFTYKFITKGTVEEKILKLQQQKMRLANELITTEESFVKNLSKEDIMSIFE